MLLSTSTVAADAGGLLKGQEVCTLTGPEGLQAFVHAFKGYVNNTQSLKVDEYPSARLAQGKEGLRASNSAENHFILISGLPLSQAATILRRPMSSRPLS